ncbi:MAG TPA: SGNH/GDSL hydrolase family protein [Pilimelia sp.]|nr:SGNH/GDSL hydrolase family protein [Pilimelia sp.]
MTQARRSLAVLSALVAALALPLATPAPAAAGPAVTAAGPAALATTTGSLSAAPSTMASLGDSITRGFNACGFYFDCTSRSFSTGTTSSVNSHYLRIRAVNPQLDGRNYNEARSGARAADLPGQAGAAVSRGAQYVTVLIGANDACTSTEATMTPVATFRGHIDTALDRLKAGLPTAQVLVVSIPDVRRLWDVGRVNGSARMAWSLFRICQSMLANPTSTAQADVDRRARVRQRVIDYNTQLAQACAAYGPNCRFDGNAVFGYPFVLSQVSTWDYFHPNTTGQTVLASITYAAGFGW